MVPPTDTYEFDFQHIPGRSKYGIEITDVTARNLPQMHRDGEVWVTLYVQHRGRDDPLSYEERAVVRVVAGDRAFLSTVDSTYGGEVPVVVRETIEELREHAAEITVPRVDDPRAGTVAE